MKALASYFPLSINSLGIVNLHAITGIPGAAIQAALNPSFLSALIVVIFRLPHGYEKYFISRLNKFSICTLENCKYSKVSVDRSFPKSLWSCV